MRYLVGIMLLCLLSLPLGAGEARAEGRGPCAREIETFCKDVKPGGGRIVNCLKEHESELSEACRERGLEMREKAKEKVREAHQACRGDIEQFCKDVQPGGGRIVRCLKENEAQLSVACREQMGQRRPRQERDRVRTGPHGEP